jgi:hypothetical protein
MTVFVPSGTILQPTNTSYRAIALTANLQLYWPINFFNTPDITAAILNVNSAAGGPFTITMPDATNVSVGQLVTFNNVGSFGFIVKDNAGGTILSAVAPGVAYNIYVIDNTTAAGQWSIITASSSGGGGGAPGDAPYIVKTPVPALINSEALSTLALNGANLLKSDVTGTIDRALSNVDYNAYSIYLNQIANIALTAASATGMLLQSNNGVYNSLNIGASGYVLTSNGTSCLWAPASGGAINIINPNIIIGGDFDVNPWQRTGAGGIVPVGNVIETYVADRFVWRFSTNPDTYVYQNTLGNVPSSLQTGTNVETTMHFNSKIVVPAAASGDCYLLCYRVEGYDYVAYANEPLTLSFAVYLSHAGTYCVSFSNAGQDQYYIYELEIPTPNTWNYVSINMPAPPTTGTWDYTHGIGLDIRFCLDAGADFVGTAGAWNTGNAYCTANQVHGLNGILTMETTLFKLELGVQRTKFVNRPVAQEWENCQRYYCKSYDILTAPGTATPYCAINSNTVGDYLITNGNPWTLGQHITFPVIMRNSTFNLNGTVWSTTGAINSWRFTPLNSVGVDVASGVITHSTRGMLISNATGGVYNNSLGVAVGHYTADHELYRP